MKDSYWEEQDVLFEFAAGIIRLRIYKLVAVWRASLKLLIAMTIPNLRFQTQTSLDKILVIQGSVSQGIWL